MAQPDFVNPSPTPISDVSPSLANMLMSCQLRVAFARDPQFRSLRRPGTHSVLGIAAHAVTEAAFRRSSWSTEDSQSVRSHLEEVWKAEIRRGASELERAWAPAQPPPPRDWPGYGLTRARTIRRAVKLLSIPRSGHHPPAPSGGIEIELRDPSSGLFGRADRIERKGNSVRVVDLKTGLRQGEPTTDQRRQLLLYAILVQRSFGEWPQSVAVEDASGLQHVLDLDIADAELALSEVEAARAAFNLSVELGTFVAQAAPNPDLCRWCEYRVQCRPYWSVLSSEWMHRAALGDVIELGETGGGDYVELSITSPNDRAGERIHVAQLHESLPTSTHKVAIVDWSGHLISGAVQIKWSTTVRAF